MACTPSVAAKMSVPDADEQVLEKLTEKLMAISLHTNKKASPVSEGKMPRHIRISIHVAGERAGTHGVLHHLGGHVNHVARREGRPKDMKRWFFIDGRLNFISFGSQVLIYGVEFRAKPSNSDKLARNEALTNSMTEASSMNPTRRNRKSIQMLASRNLMNEKAI